MTATGTITITVEFDVEAKSTDMLDELGVALKNGAGRLAYTAVEKHNTYDTLRANGRYSVSHSWIKNTNVRVSKNITE